MPIGHDQQETSNCRFFSPSCAISSAKVTGYTMAGLLLVGVTIWEAHHGTDTTTALMVMLDAFAASFCIAYNYNNCAFPGPGDDIENQGEMTRLNPR